MSFPKYPAYKDSGCDRLGRMPDHWQVLPCRAFMDERRERNADGSITNYLSLMANVGVVPYEKKGDVGNKKPDDLNKCKRVYVGDLVINSMNYGIGSYGLSPFDGVCSPVYIVLTPRSEQSEPRYALRVFEDRAFQTFAQSFGNGILAHRAAIGWDDLKNIKIALPPVSEQKQLAAFLDHETAKIDALIAEQQRLIELLKEKRQAVISHAVTKGLNPDVPMKDSGVEWLGEVPAHWEVKPLRYLGECQNGINIAGDAFGAGFPFVGYGDVYKNEVLPRAVEGLVQSTDLDRRRYSVVAGDIFFTRTSETVDEIGFSSVCMETIEDAVFAGFLIRFRPRAKALKPAFARTTFAAKGCGSSSIKK